MLQRCIAILWLTIGCLFLLPQLATAQELIFTAPPREKPEAGAKQYGPLAAHLSKLLDRNVRYVHPGNWLNYQRDMRADRYDIVFDGPHFASWRMAHLGHDALVRLPGSLEFFLLTNKGENEIHTTDDLVGQKICGIAPPNLSTLSIIAKFNNPVRQPVVKAIRGGMSAVVKAFDAGQCRAAVVRNTFFSKKMSNEQRARYRIIYQANPLPNQSITASKRVSEREKMLITQSLTNGDGIVASQPILKRFGGKKAKSFVLAKAGEFNGINSLLEGVIFGW